MPIVTVPPGFHDLDDAAVARWFARLRWGTERPACAACGAPTWQLRTRVRVFACTRCTARRSVTAGTLFHRARIPLVEIVFLAWNLCQEVQPSARALSRALGRRLETVWAWCHRLRVGHCQQIDPLRDQLVAQGLRLPLQRPNAHARPMPAQLRERLRWTFKAPVQVVTDLEGRFVQAWVGEATVELVQERYATEAVPVCHHVKVRGRAAAVRDELVHQVRYVAFGVSLRWMQRYASFACIRRADPVPELLLGRCLDTTTTPFAALVPGLGPLDEALQPHLQDVRAFYRLFRGGSAVIAPSS